MTTKRSLIEEAEQNVLNICKEMELAMDALMAFERFGNQATKHHLGRNQFFEGLNMMRTALRKEYMEQISRCFALSGVGGEEAANYAKKKARDYFGGNYELMSFLDKWGNLGSYNIADEKQFKEELKEALD